MIYRKLLYQLIIRVILILANTMLFAYIFFLHKYPAAQLNLILILFAQSAALVYYLNKTNRDLAHFFSSVSNSDSTIVFNNENSDKSFSNLYKQLNKVNKTIEQARLEKIGKFEYLKQVIEHAGAGILSFDENYNVDFYNPAAREILKIHNIKSILELDKTYPGFTHKLRSLKTNHQQLLNIKSSQDELNLSIKLVEFVINNSKIKLFTFQNIHTELEIKEVESWQKIIRVLTHEIMNSISPINSATNSISKLFKENDVALKPEDINQDKIDKTLKGMKIIEQRSTGMLSFVQNFRDLTLIPEPQKSNVSTQELFQSLEILFENELKTKNILFKYNSTPTNLSISADKAQLEQILINLIRNAIEGLNNVSTPFIELASYKNEKNNTVITITDNGKGIDKEILENIFIPFFTTKEKGSGIGLSLSRQIMHLHNGSISVKSVPNVKTIFTLQF